ncbi:sugar transferase [Candidatus Peregrinibacteria bacterium]|nr:sugar transferase [Candidatus Peregrinibacteria bacterium]
MKRSEIIFGALRIPIDFLMVTAAFWLAYYLRPITDLIPGVQYYFRPELLPSKPEYLKFSLLGGFFLVVLLAYDNFYSLRNTHRFSWEFLKIVFWVSAWVMFLIAYYFLVVHQLFFSRIALAHIWFFAILLLAIGRAAILWIQSFLLRFGIGKRKILFLGADSLAENLFETLKNNPHYEVMGALADVRESRKSACLQIIGTYQELEAFTKKYHIEEVIQASPAIENRGTEEILSFCRCHQIKYHFIPDLLKLQRTNVEVEMIGDLPLVSLKATSLDGWGAVYKRLLDFFFSLTAILLLTPLWIIVAILIKIDSPGPIFYKSQRMYRGKIFWFYKFRSMVAEAEQLKGELLERNERSGPLFKIKNDPRITKLGRFLRKTSTDEFPQLFNVLKGEMSLVGPRPHLPEEVERYEHHHYRVFAIKPGMTGIAQIAGRSNLDFEEEVRLDVYYIENWSPWLDLKIMLKSIGVIFRGNGV